MLSKECDSEQFCISDGFSHFSPSLPSSCFKPCQLPVAKPTWRYSKPIEWFRQGWQNHPGRQGEPPELHAQVRRRPWDRPGTSMGVDEAMVATRCTEVHIFSVTCSFFLSGPWSDQQKTNALTKTTTCAVCTNKDKNLCVSHRVICKFFWDNHDNSWCDMLWYSWTWNGSQKVAPDSLFNPCNYFLHQDCNKNFPINWQTQSLTLKLTLALGKSKTSTKTLVLLAIAQNGGGHMDLV